MGCGVLVAEGPVPAAGGAFSPVRGKEAWVLARLRFRDCRAVFLDLRLDAAVGLLMVSVVSTKAGREVGPAVGCTTDGSEKGICCGRNNACDGVGCEIP